MPPQLATLICALAILYLFRVDRKKKPEGVSSAVWAPFVWMFLSGSRFVSQWLNLGEPVDSVDVYMQGSPIDRAVFLALIIVGVLILMRRRLNWGMLIRQNSWVFLFFLFGAISILWSDYAYVSLKRWIKALGNLIMALVIVTEERPDRAIGTILRRLSFLLLPLSVLFIRYYPDLGRAYRFGLLMYTGVSTQKNGLGAICLLCGVYYCWQLVFDQSREIDSGRRLPVSIYIFILPMIVWLLYMANSATALVCLIVAVSLILVSRIPAIVREPGRIVIIGLTAVFVAGILEAALNLSQWIISTLGRDPTLTTRVPMWQGLIAMAENPVIGVGYESFWLGDRLSFLWAVYGQLHQAHNGYLEIYLNLGLIGLALILGFIVSGMLKARKQLTVHYPFAVLRLAAIVAVVVYNWTEATFYGVNNMWLLLFVAILDTTGQQALVSTDSRVRYNPFSSLRFATDNNQPV